MILKQEITSLATILSLLPTTIERDYVLSWVLYGISKHNKLSEWLFKGGTCLKKCYFETHRFSEDLDFTVPSDSIYDKEGIITALNEVAAIVYQETGITLTTREIEVKESKNKRDKKTYVAKFTYLGPLNLPSRNQQRIRFDITNDEIIIDAPDMRSVFHSYSDKPSSPTKIKCYSINEILAEKTRALYERQGRARDIYDIVNISRNFREHVDIKKAKSSLKEKFRFKLLPEPNIDLIFSRINFGYVTTNWNEQLGHQVQILPSAENFYNDLRPALSWWMEEKLADHKLKVISKIPTETTIPRNDFPIFTTQQIKKLGKGKQLGANFYNQYLDKIRYAARNRLCVKIQYHNAMRIVEPYSLRRPKTGNILLYVRELTKNNQATDSVKAYNIIDIMHAEIMQQTFQPQYAVEL